MTYDMQILGFNASGATGTFTVADAEARAQLGNKLDATALPEAIDAALEQAKASGEFDGAPGDSGVHVGAAQPTGDQNVWIDPDGEASGMETWTFTLADGSIVTKTVVVL